MRELLAFCLPPLMALTGVRLNEWLFRQHKLLPDEPGLRFALGLATSTLFYSQILLLAVVVGIDAARPLAWAAVVWGTVEVLIRGRDIATKRRWWRPRRVRLPYLLLLPVAVALALMACLSVLDGILEFDGIAFWVFKAKVMFLKQGAAFREVHHDPTLAYAHWDYPLLVPGLYTLGHGLAGQVHDFTYKVWPFWMLTALLAAVLSTAGFFKRPSVLPAATATVMVFLPGNFYFARMEGGTMPMIFIVSTTALMLMRLFTYQAGAHQLGMTILLLAGCAATKFEGMIFAALTAAALIVIISRRKCWSERTLWTGVWASAAALLPYLVFRLTEPVAHPESTWLAQGLAAWPNVIARFPKVWLLCVANRFFRTDGLRISYSTDGEATWSGINVTPGAPLDEELDLLGWILIALTIITWWKRPGYRLGVATLLAVELLTLATLALAITCLERMQFDWRAVAEFGQVMVGRYYLPFFVAWLVGFIIPWLLPARSNLATDGSTVVKPAYN